MFGENGAFHYAPIARRPLGDETVSAKREASILERESPMPILSSQNCTGTEICDDSAQRRVLDHGLHNPQDKVLTVSSMVKQAPVPFRPAHPQCGKLHIVHCGVCW
jgi:hypothetical protein